MLAHIILASLTLDAGNLLAWIFCGALAGLVTARFMSGGFGCIGDIILGIIGGFSGWVILGLFIAGAVAWWGTAFVAVLGAIVVVSIGHALSRPVLLPPMNTPSNSSFNATASQNVAATPMQPAYKDPSSHIVLSVERASSSPGSRRQPSAPGNTPASQNNAPSVIQPAYAAPPSYPLAPSVASTSVPIFVSHSHADNLWCRAFVDALKRNGCDVWYDEQELGGGVIWQKQIVQQLQSRPLFVVVLSPDATASQWVDEEIQLAISSRRKIIPVHHRQTAIEGFLTNRQVVDVRGMDGARAATIVAQAARQLIAV